MPSNEVERICEKHNNPFYCLTCSRRHDPLPPYITDCKEEGHEFGRLEGVEFPDFSIRVKPGGTFLVCLHTLGSIYLRYDVEPFEEVWVLTHTYGETTEYFPDINSAIRCAELWSVEKDVFLWIDPREDIL